MRQIIITAFAAIAFTAPAHAANAICVVADPTGTPLNIRIEPNGDTVARVRNGEKRLVFFEGTKTDSRGRVWYEVAMSTRAAPGAAIPGLRFAPSGLRRPRQDAIDRAGISTTSDSNSFAGVAMTG